MLGLGVGEIVIVALVLLVFVGPDRLPQFMRWMGRHYGQLRRAADDLRRAFVLEADRMDAEERYAKLDERRRLAREARQRALENAGPGSVAHEPQRPPVVPAEAQAAEAQSADSTPDASDADAPVDPPPQDPVAMQSPSAEQAARAVEETT